MLVVLGIIIFILIIWSMLRVSSIADQEINEIRNHKNN